MNAGATLFGVVTNFNFGKTPLEGGYGFIQCDQVGTDVYFRRKDLPQDLLNFGYNKAIENRSVSFVLSYSADGKPQGSSIQLVQQVDEPIVGFIKSYSALNRYGFIESQHCDDMIYFQQVELPKNMKDLDGRLLTGRKVMCELEWKPDGKPWGKNLRVQSLDAARNAIGDIHHNIHHTPGNPKTRSMLGKRPAMPSISNVAKKQKLLTIKGSTMCKGGKGGKGGARKIGTVKTYNDANMWGFIGSEVGDCYFQKAFMNEAYTHVDITVGCNVSFSIVFNPQGKQQAKDIMLL